jgi:glutamate-ammonia-ligase adenylyltransferase
VVDAVCRLAMRELRATHGMIPAARFAVVGYGSLGGEELGFGSDLDLVFLYDAPPEAHSDAARPLDAPRWFARLAQKIVALLGIVTGAGRLYEVDVRLRPDGASGLLVSSLASYADYQRMRAWTWEHQALVRARFVCGDAGLRDEFEAVRAAALARARDGDALRADIAAMRAKMRAELDRSEPGDAGEGHAHPRDVVRFDLKQGEGGLVDLEFLLQFLVLQHATAHPSLLASRATPVLLMASRDVGVLDAEVAASLVDAHAVLLAAGLECTLDRRARIVAVTPTLQRARGVIVAAVRSAGLHLQG